MPAERRVAADNAAACRRGQCETSRWQLNSVSRPVTCRAAFSTLWGVPKHGPGSKKGKRVEAPHRSPCKGELSAQLTEGSTYYPFYPFYPPGVLWSQGGVGGRNLCSVYNLWRSDLCIPPTARKIPRRNNWLLKRGFTAQRLPCKGSYKWRTTYRTLQKGVCSSSLVHCKRCGNVYIHTGFQTLYHYSATSVPRPPVGGGVPDAPWAAILYGVIWVRKGWREGREWVG